MRGLLGEPHISLASQVDQHNSFDVNVRKVVNRTIRLPYSIVLTQGFPSTLIDYYTVIDNLPCIETQ